MKLRLFHVGAASIEASPFALLPVLLAILLGKTGEMLLTLFALSLHEAAHTAMAYAVGVRIASVELLPFGFAARTAGKPLRGWDELAVAAAGPLFSLVAGMGCFAAYSSGIAPYPAVRLFSGVNTALCLLNLFPALPLDGGRMLSAAVGLFAPGRAAARFCGWLGVIAGAAGAALSLWKVAGPQKWLFAAVCALLLLTAVRELRPGKGEDARRMLARWEGVRGGCCVGVRTVALGREVTAQEALRHAYGGRLTMFYVLGSGLEVLGVVSETQLLEGAARYGGGVALGELLPPIDLLNRR